jgi:hypothetical protein
MPCRLPGAGPTGLCPHNVAVKQVAVIGVDDDEGHAVAGLLEANVYRSDWRDIPYDAGASWMGLIKARSSGRSWSKGRVLTACCA